jgi:hypothetical protein
MAKIKTSSRSSAPMGNRTTQTLDCSECGLPVDKVDINSIAVVCSSCVSKMCSGSLGPMSSLRKSKKEKK